MTKQKIISGSYNYVQRTVRPFQLMGWRVIEKKKWSDGKWTYVLAHD